MKRFKKITEGHQVIMGKLTYESLPVRPLPNRTNIIISETGIPSKVHHGIPFKLLNYEKR
jgi:dihydrofolate reductase